MKDITDPTIVTDLIDNRVHGYTEDDSFAVDVEPGGCGTTSASCYVVLEDPATGESQRFLIRVDLDEEDGDD